MNKKKNELTPASFAKIFNDEESNFPLLLQQTIKEFNFEYRIVEGKEYEEAISKIEKTLESNLKVSGPHRINDWEKGWGEHLSEFNRDGFNNLVAKFSMQGEYIRLQGDLIKPESNSFEEDFVAVIRAYLFNKYFKRIKTFYEFGAGTGVNLVAASEILPKVKLVGLDWTDSSTAIMNLLREKLKINLFGKKFDLFNPDKKYRLEKNCGVLTIGTLEQLGNNFKPFINYLLENKPNICIHLETLYELYDENNLLDYLARKYLEKRNYLTGFLPYLQQLQAKRKIEILEIRRTFGSFYHEGYTYIVWKPL